jgi:serine/threonine-protein kinase
MSIHESGVPVELFHEEPTSPSRPSARRVPFAENWDKYELLDFLGKGGMGLVFRARDRKLDRIVAIKFVLEANQKMAARFLCEARAQSRIDHPNICRVYEVGEIAEHAYIALQYVQGKPLQREAHRLSLEEKILVIRDVAAAIHEAHRLGVVHRDLKPSNILVERTAEGRWFPVVMDFGLARELSVNTPSMDPELVQGTPAYMSPEQARGDSGVIDRRSDVYSLGASLYELVTGQVPFTGESSSQILARVLREDPPPPRSLVPDLPADLEAVILQCLAKDPAQRYPSARALADDLSRYLDGEPVLGHHYPLWRQARAMVRHHPLLTTAGTSGLVLIAIVAVLGIRARALMSEARERADKRACLIRRVSEEVGKIGSSLREAYLRPLHDVRPDRQRAREGLRVIETELHDPGTLDAGFVHAALGRGHLALREWGGAIQEFQAAQGAGVSTPELHAGLGRAFGEMYFRSLGGISRPVDMREGTATGLAARRADLVKRYLDPARHELEIVGDKSSLSRIRSTLYSRDFAVAEQRAREAVDADPDSLEACEIAGQAAILAATEAFDHGDYDRALPILERAAAAFARGSLVARSDGTLYRAAADTWLLVAEIEQRRQRPPLASLQRALDLLDHGALVADPEDAMSYVTRAYVLLRWYRAGSGAPFTDEAELLDRVVGSAVHAVTIDPKDPRALVALGIAYIYRGSYEFFHGSEGAPWWHLAAARLEEALVISPDDPRASNALGLAHRWLGDELVKAGRDPGHEYETAGKSFALALVIDPGYIRACVSQAELATLAAEFAELIGQDPLPAVEKARLRGRQCLAADSTSYSVLDVLARAEIALAGYLLKTGGDPTRVLVEARDLLDRSAAGLPDHGEMWFQRGAAARIEASYRVRRGIDPTEAISQAQTFLKKVLQQMPSCAWARIELGRLDLLEEAHGRSVKAPVSEAFLEEARQRAESAVEIDGRLPWARLVAAEVYLRIAMASGSRTAIERGIVHADEASRLFPGISGGRDVRDALEQLRRR